MEPLTIEAKPRQASGTKAARRLRESGELPAIIYGHGEPTQAVSLPAHEVINELHHGAHVLHVRLEGVDYQYFIKEVQYAYLGTNPVHLDLARVNLDARVQVPVPVALRGVPMGIREGGVLDQLITDLEVECVVTQIPESLRPRVVGLGVGESLHVTEVHANGGSPVSGLYEILSAAM